MYNFKRKEGVLSLIAVLFLVFMTLGIVASTIAVNAVKTNEKNIIKINEMESCIQEKDEKIKAMVENNKTLQEHLQNERQEKIEMQGQRARSISNLQSRGGFNRYTDIALDKDLTVKDIDKIIDFWDNHVKGGTRFKGHGVDFINASKASGINPIIILAHAASESQWGNSYIAKTKNNFFGINCIDSDPSAGFVMGDDMEAGLINGAVWVKKNFYKNGYTSLQAMLNGNYASDPNWAATILNIANTSVRVLQR